MRLMARFIQVVQIAPNTTATGSLGSQIATYGTKVSVSATVQPLSSERVRAEYGTRADRIRQMFLPVGTVVKEGYGVWLAGENTANPPWVVISVSEWQTHTEARIERRDAVG